VRPSRITLLVLAVALVLVAVVVVTILLFTSGESGPRIVTTGWVPSR
jgi:hypothetical protein